MEIKHAHNEEDSTTLEAARSSERWAIGLVVASAIAGMAWLVAPDAIKAKIPPFLAAAGAGVGVVLKLGLVQVKNGRLKVGDLDEAVQVMALLPGAQLEMLQRLKPVIEGNIDLTDMPEVRDAIKEATRSVVPTPPVREVQTMPPLFPDARQRVSGLNDLAMMAQEAGG